jgi:hypothetical protein
VGSAVSATVPEGDRVRPRDPPDMVDRLAGAGVAVLAAAGVGIVYSAAGPYVTGAPDPGELAVLNAWLALVLVWAIGGVIALTVGFAASTVIDALLRGRSWCWIVVAYAMVGATIGAVLAAQVIPEAAAVFIVAGVVAATAGALAAYRLTGWLRAAAVIGAPAQTALGWVLLTPWPW